MDCYVYYYYCFDLDGIHTNKVEHNSSIITSFIDDDGPMCLAEDDTTEGTMVEPAQLQLVVEVHDWKVVVDKTSSIPPNFAVTPEAQRLSDTCPKIR